MFHSLCHISVVKNDQVPKFTVRDVRKAEISIELDRDQRSVHVIQGMFHLYSFIAVYFLERLFMRSVEAIVGH